MKIITAIILLSFTLIASQIKNTSTVLHYLVREPEIKSEKTPAVILLHGVGSNEQDLFSFADQLPAKYLVVSARAPITLDNNSYGWYRINFANGKTQFIFEEEEQSRNDIITFIEQIRKKYSIDANQIYLIGFSQGAIMSYSVALTRPDLVKGIAAVSGRLLEEIKPKIAAPEKMQHLKVLISHGKNDNVLPVNNAPVKPLHI